MNMFFHVTLVLAIQNYTSMNKNIVLVEYARAQNVHFCLPVNTKIIHNR